MKKPGKRDLHRSGLHGCRYAVENRRLQWGEPAQWEEGYIGHALLGQSVDEGIVTAPCHVVEVLDANNLCDFLGLLELPGGDVAETDVAYQFLALHFGKHSQRFFDRFFRRLEHCTDPEVDDVEPVDSEIPQIVMNGVDQLLA